MNKAYAALFAPFWNEIIKSLREEDYISNRLIMGTSLLSFDKFICVCCSAITICFMVVLLPGRWTCFLFRATQEV